jgi:hypothetical protein
LVLMRACTRIRALAGGAGGTPSAVLVDAEDKVASEVAVGEPAVLEVAGVRRSGLGCEF